MLKEEECGELRDRVKEYLDEYGTLTARSKQREVSKKEMDLLDRSKEMLARKTMNMMLELRAKGCRTLKI